MLKFETLVYQNFQSVGNAPITIHLNKSPTTLIGGHNGAGKSTVLEAMTYALFGKSLKKVKLTGLINAINKKKMLVTITFVKNGKTYRVVRGEKPKVFEIYCDNQLYNQTAASRDNQTQLEYILGVDFKMFTQVLVLNKERYVPFMDLDASSRRKVVEDVLDISAFSVASEIVKEQMKESTTKISNLKYDLDITTDKLKNVKALIREVEANTSSLVQEQKNIISDAVTRIESIELERQNLSQGVAEGIAEINSKLTVFKTKRREIEMFRTQFNFKIGDMRKTRSFYTDNDSCPTCNQPINLTLRKTKQSEVDVSLSEYQDALNSCMVQLDELSSGEQVLNQEMSIYAAKQQKIQDLDNQKRLLILRANDAEKMILKLSGSTPVDQYLLQAQDLDDHLSEVTNNLNLEFANEAQLKILRDLLKDDGIKAHIIAEYLDFLNDRINKYLYSMDFYLNLTLDSNFNDTIHNSQYEGFVYDNLSTGQKCRVNLAIWLALLEVASVKNSIACNTLFLDEILENIDADGVQLVMKLIRSKLSDKNVFVITQRFDEFRDSFTSDIKFKLEEDFTVFS